MTKNNLQNQRCAFFEACGGCLYLNLLDENYYKIKIENLKKDLDKIFDEKEKNIFLKSENFFKIGPKSRRKITLQIDGENKVGFFSKASKTVVAIDKCFIAQDEISALILPLQKLFNNFEKNLVTQIALTAFDNIIDVVFLFARKPNFAQIQKLADFAKAFKINASTRIKNEITPVLILQPNQIFYPDFKIDLDGEVFIQATKNGAQKIAEIILNFVKNNFDKKISIADIYTGFGAYSFALSSLAKEIYAFEGSEKMANLILKNATKNGLKNKIKIENRDLILYPISEKELEKFDLAIINPPRNGAGPQIKKIAVSKLKNLIYVSCNPKTFANDAKILLDNGFKIKEFFAIDQFYSSPHLEVVGRFSKN